MHHCRFYDIWNIKSSCWQLPFDSRTAEVFAYLCTNSSLCDFQFLVQDYSVHPNIKENYFLEKKVFHGKHHSHSFLFWIKKKFRKRKREFSITFGKKKTFSRKLLFLETKRTENTFLAKKVSTKIYSRAPKFGVTFMHKYL